MRRREAGRVGDADSGTASTAVLRPVASAVSSSATSGVSVSRASSVSVAITELVRYGAGATARPSSSSTTAASRWLAPWPPSFSGTSRPAAPMSAASAFHSSAVVRRAVLGAHEHGRRVAAVGEQGAYGGAQVVLGLGVQQVSHRARSFQATSLSLRGSEGSPSTRSATMFSSTSLVPPSMRVALGAQIAVAGVAPGEVDEFGAAHGPVARTTGLPRPGVPPPGR